MPKECWRLSPILKARVNYGRCYKGYAGRRKEYSHMGAICASKRIRWAGMYIILLMLFLPVQILIEILKLNK